VNAAATLPPLRVVILRALRLRCPSCGAPTLFTAYLKLSRTCSACGANFSRSETADVAPYLTVFILGLILTPLTLALASSGRTSVWVLALLVASALAAALLLLPRVKGVLAALLWRAQREM
jgi:uncharacterized protein (DUF983 family)